MTDNLFIISAIFGAAPILLIAAIAWSRRRKKYDLLSSAKGYHLRYCSESRFRSWWKFFPWEGVGKLVVDQNNLVFEGLPNDGESFIVHVPIEQLELYGRQSWFRNGFLPWLLLKNKPSDYYLCVETGPWIFGAGAKTRELLKSINQQAEQDGAPDS